MSIKWGSFERVEVGTRVKHSGVTWKVESKDDVKRVISIEAEQDTLTTVHATLTEKQFNDKTFVLVESPHWANRPNY